MKLLTTEQLAEELTTTARVVRKWTRQGIIKPEILVGKKPRFILADAVKQIKAHNRKQSADTYNGMIPTL